MKGLQMKNSIIGAALMTMVTSSLLSVSLVNPAAAQIDPSQLDNIKAIKLNNSQVITAGLPTAEQFQKLKHSGVEVVINLIPKDNSNYLAAEDRLVTDAGMVYHNIEVDWQQPTMEDVAQFISIMERNNDKSILVHCALNYRASAFYYLFQLSQGADHSENAMNQALSPWGDLPQSLAKYPQWKTLIDEVRGKYQQ
ncbi:protein tyrosine phosphatase family protein [Shewanella sp. 3_MG-2023]|uniref:protein tyrosine phosphatase family protein n=1 Tax=Shewanella sp. 3_MG-2023 TaxID=3062635 RepID=UPI0026E3B546|nr:protein tyrosine phosphatase family protein [Shewanella sp. 3_MG-2023]MDO6776544.1 protein tyrosine phosphatase family protein [Shewanella sp. 3_MG-2023]